jgi:hypothetical protein
MLSWLLAKQFENKEFYEQSSVAKLIDMQFDASVKVYGCLMLILMFNLMCFLIGLYVEDVVPRTVLLFLCSIPQALFLYLESLEIKSSPSFWEYLEGNKSNFFMPIFFMGHVFLFYWVTYMEDDRIPNKF